MSPNPARRRCTVSRLGLVEYQAALDMQGRLVDECRGDRAQQLLLLEHPPTYTLGARGKLDNLLVDEASLAQLGASVHRIDRGGDVTFHGPGQLVGYPIIDLSRWGQGPLWYVRSLEAVLIDALASFGIDSQRRPGRPGAWIGDAKIASIGVHVSRGITSHGFALNVDPDLSFFSHIVPCGMPDITMTSMAQAFRSGGPRAAQGGQMPAPTPRIDAVMDAVVQSFANAFEMELRDGDRTVAPAAWTPAMAL
jgi:lipoate-protein ligase B